MTNWQKEFDNFGNNPGTINFMSLTPREKKIIKKFISTLLEAEHKKGNKELADAIIMAKEGWIFQGKKEMMARCKQEKIMTAEATEEFTRNQLLKEIDQLIAEEMIICHKEGTPTSRLTSLSEKLNNLNHSERR